MQIERRGQERKMSSDRAINIRISIVVRERVVDELSGSFHHLCIIWDPLVLSLKQLFKDSIVPQRLLKYTLDTP